MCVCASALHCELGVRMQCWATPSSVNASIWILCPLTSLPIRSLPFTSRQSWAAAP